MRLLTCAFILLTAISCGSKSDNSAAKIKSGLVINGREVQDNEELSRFIVGVYDTEMHAICTGTLIAENIVLTAAHCKPEKPKDLKIIFSTNVDDAMNSREPDVLEALVLPVTDFKTAPGWSELNESEFNTHDIALVKFKGKIPTGYLPAKWISDEALLKVGQSVAVAGFGVDKVNVEKINPKKHKNILKAISSGEVVCDEDDEGELTNCLKVSTTGDGLLRTAAAPISVMHTSEVQLDETKSGTCSGDSGGPAFLKLDGIYYLFGVTSRGTALCNEVGIYTNAMKYLKWISETSKTLI